LKVELIMSTEEKLIGECAKICYASKSIEDGGRDITSSLVHKSKHLSVLRFAYASFHIEGISVACQNQLVRSKHLDFLVESKRYVDPEKGGFEFIMPKVDETAQQLINNHWDNALELYKYLIGRGVKKEDARAVLPMNTSTKVNVSGNLQSYMDFLRLRLSSKAQKEIRDLANEIYLHLSVKFPQVFTKEIYLEFSK